jgi:ribosomal protein S18 acetylase RimI-like enzyme
VLSELAKWGAARNAALYLQVARANTPAMRLYAKAGFTEACEYHYRSAV